MLRPAVADHALTGEAQAFAVVDAKVVFAIGDGNFFALMNIASGHNSHALGASSHETAIGITVVVGKAGRAQEEGGGFATAGHDDAEILPGQTQIGLFLLGHGDEGTTEVFDLLTGLDELAGAQGGLSLSDEVAVGGGHFERRIWMVHLDVFAQMTAKPLLFTRAREIGRVFLQSWQLEQFALGSGEVFGDGNITEENATDVVVVDTASGGVLVPVLANIGPKVGLSGLKVSGSVQGGSIAGQGRT